MTKRQVLILFGLPLVLLIAYLYSSSRQSNDQDYLDIDSARPASQEDAKKMQATWEAGATVTADFMTMTTPTPDATATRNYLYTHMDEFVSPLMHQATQTGENR